MSGRADLNRGPHGPEPCALAGLSYAPYIPTGGKQTALYLWGMLLTSLLRVQQNFLAIQIDQAIQTIIFLTKHHSRLRWLCYFIRNSR